MTDLARAVHRRLVDEGGDVGDIPAMVGQLAPLLPADERTELHREVASLLGGFGPLDRLFADPQVSEVMVNGPGPVWVERAGVVQRSDVEVDRAELDVIIERIVAPIGRRIDPLQPWIDGRLADGSRVNIVGRPVAVDGPYLTVRRFAAARPALGDFVDPDLPIAGLLCTGVDTGETLLISGGTATGKTSLLNALAARLDPATRVVTVEDAAELALPLPHVVRLECRPPGSEGGGRVDVRDLVRTALRMRPDRLVIGEIRGPEAFDLMQAFNTGHRGGMATIHANGPLDALRRLLTLVLSADTGVPADVVAAQLAAAIDLVVHLGRGPGCERRVVDVGRVGPGLEVVSCV